MLVTLALARMQGCGMLLNAKLRTTLLSMVQLRKKETQRKRKNCSNILKKLKNTTNVMADGSVTIFFEAQVKVNSILYLKTQGLITRSRGNEKNKV